MRPEGLDCETRFFSPEHYNQQAKEIVSYVCKTEISDQCKTWPPGYRKLRFYIWFSSFDSEIKQNVNFDKLTVPVPVVQKQNEILGDIGLKRADMSCLHPEPTAKYLLSKHEARMINFLVEHWRV